MDLLVKGEGSTPLRRWRTEGALALEALHRRPEVLVAIDDEFARWQVRAALHRAGWTVREHTDGWSVLDNLAGALLYETVFRTPDLVLFDDTLRGPSQRIMIEAIHSVVPGLPVVLLTGLESIRPTPRGFVATLEEPFTAERIVDAARRAAFGW